MRNIAINYIYIYIYIYIYNIYINIQYINIQYNYIIQTTGFTLIWEIAHACVSR